MTTDPYESKLKDALAYVCVHLDELLGELDEVGGSSAEVGLSLADGLIAAVEERRSPGPLLDALHAALEESGDVLGLYGRIDPDQRGGWHPVGMDVQPPAADEIVYLCPAGQCARSAWSTSEPEARCSLTGQRLRADRL